MANQETQRTAVSNLQRYLRQISYDANGVSSPPIDGIFESATQKSLREYQAEKNLPVTGIADQKTWEMLYASYRSSLAANSPPRQITLFPRVPDTVNLATGSTGFVVAALQYMLTELSINYSDLGLFPINGIFDESTARAVRIYQSHNTLRPDGKVDRETWDSVADQYNTLASQFPVQ